MTATELSKLKPGQPVALTDMRGTNADLNGRQGYLNNPLPDANGLHTVVFQVRPATKLKDATTRQVTVAASKIQLLFAQPPRNWQWFFTAKNYRYAAQPGGRQPQQLD